MAMEVMAAEEGERDVRGYDSIVLGRSRTREDGTSAWAGNCNLKASALRTVGASMSGGYLSRPPSPLHPAILIAQSTSDCCAKDVLHH
jgi:hypothetical protein